jgi:hypothetical protein
VSSIAGRAKDAALGYARGAYRALLRASFLGALVVKGAARATVAFARGSYRATSALSTGPAASPGHGDGQAPLESSALRTR